MPGLGLGPRVQIRSQAQIGLRFDKNKKWKEDGIINGARGYIEHIDVSDDNPDEVTVIWVVFQNKDLGAKYRAYPDHLKLRNFRNLSDSATPILPTRKTFKYKSGNIEYQRKQFSLTLAYAITVHKVSGLLHNYK